MWDKLSNLILIICVLSVVALVLSVVIPYVWSLLLPVFVTLIQFVKGV